MPDACRAYGHRSRTSSLPSSHRLDSTNHGFALVLRVIRMLFHMTQVGVIEIDSTGADEDQCETCCNASQVVITAPASDSERGSPAFPISGFGATSPTLRSLGSSRSGSPRMKKESSQSPTWHSVHARHEAQVEALPRANLSREGSCPTIVPWGDPSPTLLKKFDSSSSLLPLHRIDSGASFFLAPDDSTVVGPSSSTRFKRESIIATQVCSPLAHVLLSPGSPAALGG